MLTLNIDFLVVHKTLYIQIFKSAWAQVLLHSVRVACLPVVLMAKGRIPCIHLGKGALKEVLSDHLVVPLAGCNQYSQLKFRRRGKWAEMHRNRGFATDMFVATKGFCLSQSYLTSEIALAGKPLKPEMTKDDDDVENLAYRIRAMMAHFRNAKKESFPVPTRYAALAAVIHLARLDAPPSTDLDKTPCKSKVRLQRELVTDAPPPFLGLRAGATLALADGDEEEAEVLHVAPSTPEPIDMVSICSSEDYLFSKI